MKKVLFLSILVLVVMPYKTSAQSKVIVMNSNYYSEIEADYCDIGNMTKGSAWVISDFEYKEYGHYSAGNVFAGGMMSGYIPKSKAYLCGSQGERCIVLNGTNINFRESPSINARCLYYDACNPAKFANHAIDPDMGKVRLPKGSKLPYYGTVGNWYKSNLEGNTIYISKDYSYLTY